MTEYVMIPGSTEIEGEILTVGTMRSDGTDIMYLSGNILETMNSYPKHEEDEYRTLGDFINWEREKIANGEATILVKVL